MKSALKSKKGRFVSVLMPVKKRQLLVHHKEKEKYGKCTTEKEAAYIFCRKDMI